MPTLLRNRGARVLLAVALLSQAVSVLAHAGSTAFWRVSLDPAAAHSVVLLPFEDAVRFAPGMPRAAGVVAIERLGRIDEVVRDHFVVVEDGAPVAAQIRDARMLASGLLEVRLTHPLAGTGAVALRSTFHLATDESHTVVARVEQQGQGASFVLTATAGQRQVRGAGDARRPTGLFAMVRLGIAHILTGYDHLVFLACLLVPLGTWRSRVAIVTAFTAAHSLTLVLAAMRVITPPPGFVEPAIALSIAYVAIENLLASRAARSASVPYPSASSAATPVLGTGPHPSRWRAAFGFGLVHGLGFAGTLDVLHLPAREWLASVLAFNVGVEIGQLAVVAVAVPAVMLAARSRWHRPLVQSTSVLVLGLAFVWFVERL